MSNQSPFGRQNAAFPTLPRGDVLGTYESYPEAQRAVAKLAAANFPVSRLSIVGNDLKTVERVTGKLTYGRAALAGALSGLWLGIFFAIVLTLFSAKSSSLIPAAAVIGAGFGMLYGIVSFAITKRQRDFSSVHQVLATNYQIIVDPALTSQAQRILGQSGSVPSTDWGAGSDQGGNNGAGRPSAPTSGGRPGPSPYGEQSTPHGVPPQPATGENTRPRYGTNDGPRYGESLPNPTPSAPRPVHDDEPPRYGERIENPRPDDERGQAERRDEQ